MREQITALLSVAALAAQFVTEPESWPVFKAWLAKRGAPMDPEYSRVMAREQADRLLRIVDQLADQLEAYGDNGG
jgi:hypothetical protein